MTLSFYLAEHTLVIEKFVDELNRLLDVDANMRNFRVLYPEHYVMFSLVSFVDAIVGTEPDDFKVAIGPSGLFGPELEFELCDPNLSLPLRWLACSR